MPDTNEITPPIVTPYISDAFRMLLNITKQNLLEKKQLLIIKGEQGIGKSTFCQQLQFELQNHAQTLIIKSNANTHAGDIFKDMLATYQQKVEANLKDCLHALAHYLKASIQAVGMVVLILDDCHLIASRHLEYILQSLEAFDEILHGKLKLLLVGEASIEHHLQNININSIKTGEVHSANIRPIAQANYAEYIKHCASVEPLHFQLPTVLNDKQLKKLYAQSKGIPLHINQAIFTMFPKPTEKTKAKLLQSGQLYLSKISNKTKQLSKKFGLKGT